jgi:hypothetical protein
VQSLEPDPPVDQPQHVGVPVMGFEHDPSEVDDPPDRLLRVAAVMATQLLALSLRGAVCGAERPVEHLQRVVGRALEPRLFALVHSPHHARGAFVVSSQVPGGGVTHDDARRYARAC